MVTENRPIFLRAIKRLMRDCRCWDGPIDDTWEQDAQLAWKGFKLTINCIDNDCPDFHQTPEVQALFRTYYENELAIEAEAAANLARDMKESGDRPI